MKGKYRAVFMPTFEMGGECFCSAIFESEGYARAILDAIAEYTLFLHDNKIMPDHSNAGWIEKFEDGEWVEIEDDEE